jgi:DNA helicase-2/ATP-dependent DNA helicase PcrA
MNVPVPATTYFDVGKIIHSVVEQLTKLRKDGIDRTKNIAYSLLDKMWNPISFQSKTQENQERKKANEMLANFLEWDDHNPNMPLSAEQEFRIELAGVPYIGYIDRIELNPDNEIELIDFKTGYVYENNSSIPDDPQMNIYVLGAQKIYNKLPIKASIYYIEHDKTIPYEVKISQVNRIKGIIEEKTNAILNGNFVASPSYSVCKNCPYWSICDSKETEE